MPNTNIEMQAFPKAEDNVLSTKRIYEAFPFFIGDIAKIEIDLSDKNYLPTASVINNACNISKVACGNFDFTALFVSTKYKSQPKDKLAQPIHRFWKNRELTLANLCCESILKKVIEDPNYYSDKKDILP